MSEPTHPAAKPPIADRTAEHQALLDGIIRAGASLIDLLVEQAKGAPTPGFSPPRPGDVAAAYERISRGVRRGMLLARRLAEPAAEPARQHAAARRRILREVEDVIQRSADETEADALQDELMERLDAPELADEIDSRPVAEIITEICRDFGLAAMPGTHPWKRRTPADIAALCARAANAPPGPALRPALLRHDRPSAPGRPEPDPAMLVLHAMRFRDP